MPGISMPTTPRDWSPTPRLNGFGEEVLQDGLLYSKPRLTVATPVTVPKTPRTPRSLAPTPPSFDDIGCALRIHKEEVMNELTALLLRHESSLERTLADFRASLDVPRSRFGRAASTPSEYSRASTTHTSQRGFNAGSPSAMERRLSISSRASDTTVYMSMQDMREQCLAHSKEFLRRSESKTSWTSVHKMFKFEWIAKLSGKAHTLSNNFFFELIFASLICVNSVLLGVEVGIVSSSPKEEVPHVFHYSTIFFMVAFLTELCIRLLGEGGFTSFLFYSELRAWNWFDLIAAICSLAEVGFNFVLLGGGSQSVTRMMRMVRMNRLGRVLRIARIVRLVSQLRVLVISILSTLQTLLWSMFLLLIIIYVFGILLAQATAEHFADDPDYDRSRLMSEGDLLERYWGSLDAAMYTLFMSIAGGVSWEDAVFAVADVHWMWGALFTCFVAFSSFALINVMTAVFCQSAIDSAQKSMDVKWQSMCADKQKHIKTLKRLFQSIDEEGRSTVNMRKIVNCWGREDMQAFLHSMELAPDDCWTFFTILGNQDEEVSAADFVDGCLRLKGSAKAFDIAVLTYELRHFSKQNFVFMNHMQACMNSVLDTLSGAFGYSEGSMSDYISCNESKVETY